VDAAQRRWLRKKREKTVSLDYVGQGAKTAGGPGLAKKPFEEKKRERRGKKIKEVGPGIPSDCSSSVRAGGRARKWGRTAREAGMDKKEGVQRSQLT